MGPGLLLPLPSLILLAVFVYGLIGWTVEPVATATSTTPWASKGFVVCTDFTDLARQRHQ